MRRWVAVLAFLLVGCSQGSSQPVARGTSSPPPSPSPSPSAVSTPDPTLAKVDFSCRLPIFESEQSGTAPAVFVGGFVTFPVATFASDPAGGIRFDSSGGLSTDASPTLHNGELDGPPFYDKAQHRWVPAASFQSTPDGAFYAYATWDGSTSRGQVHIVDVARATEKVFDVRVPANAMGFTVYDFDSKGVYLVANAFEQLPSGVWLMDPTSGALRQLVQVAFIEAVRDGYAWAARIDPRDPSPPVLRRSGTPSDSVMRVDLATGSETTWFYRPGAQVGLAGFDSRGALVIDVSDPSGASGRTETWLVEDPRQPGVLVYAGELFLGSAQGDRDRLWLSGTLVGGIAGIYLYTQARGLQKVFTGSEPYQAFTPVGFCT